VVYGESAHLARWIPSHFARYLDELVLPNEPVLFFAECPPLSVRGWTGAVVDDHGANARGGTGRRSPSAWHLGRALDRLRTRHLRAGLLLITDRQLLVLRDYAAPDITMVQWGYVAHSVPLARLLSVRVLPARAPGEVIARDAWPASLRDSVPGIAAYDEATVPDQYARVVVALEGAGGIEVTGAAVPLESAVALAHAAEVLERFTPLLGPAGASDRRVRLVPAIEAWKPTPHEAAELDSLGGLVPPAVAEALDTATRAALQPGETLLAQARTPRSRASSGDVAALLSLTSTRLLIVEAPPRAGSPASLASGIPPAVAIHEVSLAHCTSATLRHSLLGCELACAVPAQGREQRVETIRLAFPSPLIVPLRALFSRLRLLLGTVPAT